MVQKEFIINVIQSRIWVDRWYFLIYISIMSTKNFNTEISLLIFWAYMEWPCICHLWCCGTLQNTQNTKICIFQLFVSFSLNYKKESFFKAQIKMIISSTSAFQFFKFKNIIFLYICLCGLYMSNAPWHDISHTHVSVLM